ncbi:NADP-dependent oxidoreductase [Brucella haematophila]|uniref:NADP-dependent oxidoreductase n=1 Tax=Brucella haematophila TaxID=419474 RepID=A0ABX1DPU6_9HYPH|nr:NADP-dependent oxidoreductase [Brucella haematophila]NKC03663.1 NADP-dependent oxidoreductase [Brucella haematophila]TMU96084.1 NADP-dependent oxidoreductase [Brucella haematophila]
MGEKINQRIVLASRPDGRPTAENFRLEEAAVPSAGEGEVLLKLRYLSLDPYMRGRMSAAKSYAAPVEIGSVMEGGTVGEVVESQSAGFAPGDFVLSHSGWQSYALANASTLRKLDPEQAPLTTALGVLGMPGFTAYSGLLTIGQPKEGETVVVAAATGPVGSAVGQIAKLKGARAVGIAGGADKCKALIDEFGFDVAVDHHSPNFAQELAIACPNGIDVYFENVGGKVFAAVFPLLNPFARVPVCGLIAQYNQSGPFDGPDRLPVLMRDILSKSLTIRGFIQRDFADQRPAFYHDMAKWIADGQIRYREDIVEGLENAPKAFISMLEGGNFGKLVVKLS